MHRHARLNHAHRLIDGIENGADFVPAGPRCFFDLHTDWPVHQQGKEECGGYRLVGEHAGIGILETADEHSLRSAVRIAPHERREIRQQGLEQSSLLEHGVAAGSVAGQKQLQGFIEQTRRGNPGQQFAQTGNGLGGRRLDAETQFRLKTRGAQHAHRILPVTSLGITDQA